MTWRKSGRAGANLAACVIVLAAALTALPAAAETRVEFQAPTPEGGKIKLKGLLDMPEGKGPFPAVVLLHGSSGFSSDLEAANYAAWAARLVQWGYAALRVDSFGPRGLTEVLDPFTPVSPRTRSFDTYAARDYLAKLPKVGKKPIAVMGWSHGGAAGMYIVDGAYRPATAKPFQACICYYPLPTPPSKQDTPLLLLYGDEDPFCPRSMVDQVEASWSKGSRKYESTIVRYSAATHSFDVEGLNEDSEGVHSEYDAAAAADAIEQVKEFLARHLTP